MRSFLIRCPVCKNKWPAVASCDKCHHSGTINVGRKPK